MNASTAPKTVLVVDDDAGIRRTLNRVLTDEGYAVDEAGNGREGLDHLREGPRPDLILLDLMMPVMDGEAFSGAVEREPSLADIPIVVITATGNCPQLQRSLHIRGCLRKPLDLDQLLSVVARFTA
jgi:CheY-like chemotaxis protein